MTVSLQKAENKPKSQRFSLYTVKDEKDLLLLPDLFIEWHKEDPSNSQELDWDSIIANLYMAFKRGCVIVVKDNETGKLVGGSVNFPDKPWAYKEIAMLNLCFFVAKEYRKSRISVTLLQKTKEYAKLKKMNLVISVMSNLDPELKDKFFQLYGFTKVGGTYTWNAP